MSQKKSFMPAWLRRAMVSNEMSVVGIPVVLATAIAPVNTLIKNLQVRDTIATKPPRLMSGLPFFWGQQTFRWGGRLGLNQPLKNYAKKNHPEWMSDRFAKNAAASGAIVCADVFNTPWERWGHKSMTPDKTGEKPVFKNAVKQAVRNNEVPQFVNGLYRGASVVFVAKGIFAPVIVCTKDYLQRRVQEDPEQPLTLDQNLSVVAGSAVAGATINILSSPIAEVQLRYQRDNPSPTYRLAWQEVMQQGGVWAAICRGARARGMSALAQSGALALGMCWQERLQDEREKYDKDELGYVHGKV